VESRYLPAPVPQNDRDRVAELQRYDILDTVPESGFDDLVALASELCGTPIALVSLVDSDRQWFKARVGLGVESTPRAVAFCAHAIMGSEPMIVPDAHVDERFAGNPLVTGEPHVRFYAGFPLCTPDGDGLGTLCVIDHRARELTPAQLTAMQRLQRQANAQLELRRRLRDLHETQEALKSKCNELEHFARAVSHDLQEPLRTVESFVRLYVEECAPELDGVGKQYLDFAIDGARRGKELVRSLLAYAKTRTSVAPEKVALGAVLEWVKSDLNAIVQARGAVIEADELPTLVGYPQLLRQLLQNLFSNALKFCTQPPARIHVSAERDGAYWVISVRDNGIGIPPSERERIFQPFYRSSSHSAPGTGIGLAIARRVVEAHGGTIWVESQPGEGSTFKCRLRDPGLVDGTNGAAGQ